MSFDLANWFLGVFSAVVIAIIARFVWRYLEKRLDGSADLIWFVTYSEAYEKRYAFTDQLNQIVRQALGNSSFSEVDADTKSLVEEAHQAFRSTQIVIHNSGTVLAKKISILLSRNPLSIVAKPNVSVHRSETADGKTELSINAISASEQVKLTLFGIEDYDVLSVSHEGASCARYSMPDLLPLRYVEEKKTEKRNVVLNFALFALLIVISVGAIYDGYLTLVEADKKQTNSQEQVDAP